MLLSRNQPNTVRTNKISYKNTYTIHYYFPSSGPFKSTTRLIENLRNDSNSKRRRQALLSSNSGSFQESSRTEKQPFRFSSRNSFRLLLRNLSSSCCEVIYSHLILTVMRTSSLPDPRILMSLSRITTFILESFVIDLCKFNFFIHKCP